MVSDMDRVQVDAREVEFSAIRAQEAGGQSVNKVSSTVHLRFDIPASSLPDDVKKRLLALRDTRITQEGVLVLKAEHQHSREMNRSDAGGVVADAGRARGGGNSAAGAPRHEADLRLQAATAEGQEPALGHQAVWAIARLNHGPEAA